MRNTMQVWLACAVAVIIAGCGSTATVTVTSTTVRQAAAPATSTANSSKDCGTFTTTIPATASASEASETVTVDRNPGVPCATAVNLMRKFYDGDGNYHAEGSMLSSYTTLDGWRCTGGVGGNACSRGAMSIGSTYIYSQGAAGGSSTSSSTVTKTPQVTQGETTDPCPPGYVQIPEPVAACLGKGATVVGDGDDNGVGIECPAGEQAESGSPIGDASEPVYTPYSCVSIAVSCLAGADGSSGTCLPDSVTSYADCVAAAKGQYESSGAEMFYYSVWRGGECVTSNTVLDTTPWWSG